MEITGHYSHHARRAMLQARACAQQERHALLDTGHLLVGILRAEGSLGQRVLRELELAPEEAERRLNRLHPHARPLPTELPLSDALKDTLRCAAEESHLLGHHYIGTEHLLLGLVRCGGGSARPILHAGAISLDQIRRQVRRVWQEGQTEIGLRRVCVWPG
jgi:ATP-dependent Clp protease ATP-binding subunit ClpC